MLRAKDQRSKVKVPNYVFPGYEHGSDLPIEKEERAKRQKTTAVHGCCSKRPGYR